MESCDNCWKVGEWTHYTHKGKPLCDTCHDGIEGYRQEFVNAVTKGTSKIDRVREAEIILEESGDDAYGQWADGH
jgi:NCAIR mutase (PurE)-related protein